MKNKIETFKLIPILNVAPSFCLNWKVKCGVTGFLRTVEILSRKKESFWITLRPLNPFWFSSPSIVAGSARVFKQNQIQQKSWVVIQTEFAVSIVVVW